MYRKKKFFVVSLVFVLLLLPFSSMSISEENQNSKCHNTDTPHKGGEEKTDEVTEDPVNLSNGNLMMKFTDFSLPGRGFGMEIVRTYNSQTLYEVVGFEPQTGTWELESGEYSGEGGRSLVTHLLSDFTLSVKMQTIETFAQPGPALNRQVGWIIFRFKDYGNYYATYITTDGYIELYKVKQGVSSWPVSVATGYSPFSWNTFQVEANQNNIKVYINGNLEIDYTDPEPLLEGYVGLETTHFNHSHYDDLSVDGTTLLSSNFNSVQGWSVPLTGSWGIYNQAYYLKWARSISDTTWSNFTFDGKMQTLTTSFQNFEPNNGTPGDYFWDAWDSQPAFSTTTVYRGTHSLITQGHTVGINPSSGTVDLSNARSFLLWVYDTQGNNTVELRLRDTSGVNQAVWSTMSSIQNKWTLISWPLSSFDQVDLSQIVNIEIFEWNKGTYYFDEIGYSSTLNPWDVCWINFRYTDDNNFYYFLIRTDGLLELSKWQGGSQSVLAQKPSSLSPFDWHNIRIDARQPDLIQIYVDNNLEIEYIDANPILEGRVGLYAYYSEGYFDDIAIMDILQVNSNFDNPSGLQQISGNWAIDNSEYHGSNAKALSEQSFSDFTFEADVKTITQGVQDWQVAWVFFRYANSDNHYYTLLHSDGTLELSKWQNGVPSYYIASTTTSASPFNYNHFKIEANGASIKIYLNDVLEIDYTDPNPILNGRVGIQCLEAEARYDNLLAQEQFNYLQDFNQPVITPMFGKGWTLNYEMKMVEYANGNLSFYRSDGGIDQYVKQPDGSLKNPPGIFAQVTKTATGYTRREKNGTEQHFDTQGRLTEIIDRNGNKITFNYLGEQLNSIIDTVGRTIDILYGANNKVFQIKDPLNQIWEYTYNAQGQLETVTNPLNQTRIYNYDPTTKNLIQYTDRKGNTYYYEYYYNDQVYQQTDPLGNITTFDYFWDNTFVENNRGEKYIYKFDGLHRIEGIVDPLGVKWTPISWSLSKFGGVDLSRIVSIELYEYYGATEQGGYYFDDISYTVGSQTIKFQDFEPNNGTPGDYFWDAWDSQPAFSTTEVRTGSRSISTQGHTVGVNPMSSSPVDLSNADTFIVWVLDQRGSNSIELRLRDADGNSAAVWSEMTSNEKESFVWDSDNNLTKVTDRNGQSVNFTYDSKGNLLTKTDQLGNVTTYTYDPDYNQVTSIKDANNHTTTFDYDDKGNLIKITDALSNIFTFTYNQYGQLTSTIDPLGNTTTFEYDAYGNLTKITDAQDKTTQFTYDLLGRLLTTTDANGNTTAFEYDALGRIIKVTDALNNITQYAYDNNDNVVSLTDSNGNITQFEYDALNNLTKITDAQGNITQYAYDTTNFMHLAKANLISKTDAKLQTINFEYDELNRLIQKTYPDLTTITYAYDPVSRLITVTDSNGTIAYDYDATGRLASVSYPNNMQVLYEYDAIGNLKQLTYPDNTYLTYIYNALNRLTQIKDQSQSTIATFNYDALSRRINLTLANGVTTSYSYDSASRLLSLVNEKSPTVISSFGYTYDAVGNRTSMQTLEGTYNYAYDDIYQLTQVQKPNSTTRAYNFDPVGNRVTVTNGGTIEYTTNSLNQYTQVNGVTYSYDLNGSLTSDGTNTYEYDYENRLISATTPEHSVTYTYDPFGRRLTKTVDGILQAKYVYDRENIILDLDSGNNIVAKYIYGPFIDEPLVMLKGSNVYYYSRDGLGSVTDITDSSGQVVEQYAYDEYGLPNQTSSVGNRYMFTGREYDEETGLYYYRARYYSPTLGRFLQTDPIGYIGGVNLYTYCRNNPINWVDPWGLEEEIAEKLAEIFETGAEVAEKFLPPVIREAVAGTLKAGAKLARTAGGIAKNYNQRLRNAAEPL